MNKNDSFLEKVEQLISYSCQRVNAHKREVRSEKINMTGEVLEKDKMRA